MFTLAFKMPLAEAGITAVLGYAVVFFGLVLLMCVITIMGKIMIASRKKAEKKPTVSDIPAATEPIKAEPAPGSAGEIKLYDTSDKDAAMIMAIVADKLGKPVNELRFKSIKEIK